MLVKRVSVWFAQVAFAPPQVQAVQLRESAMPLPTVCGWVKPAGHVAVPAWAMQRVKPSGGVAHEAPPGQVPLGGDALEQIRPCPTYVTGAVVIEELGVQAPGVYPTPVT
jgi:hypothetical protein